MKKSKGGGHSVYVWGTLNQVTSSQELYIDLGKRILQGMNLVQVTQNDTYKNGEKIIC